MARQRYLWGVRGKVRRTGTVFGKGWGRKGKLEGFSLMIDLLQDDY